MTSNSLWRSSFSLKNQLLDIGQRRCPECLAQLGRVIEYATLTPLSYLDCDMHIH